MPVRLNIPMEVIWDPILDNYRLAIYNQVQIVKGQDQDQDIKPKAMHGQSQQIWLYDQNQGLTTLQNMHNFFRLIGSGVLGGIRRYTPYTNLRGFSDSVYSPQ